MLTKEVGVMKEVLKQPGFTVDLELTAPIAMMGAAAQVTRYTNLKAVSGGLEHATDAK